MEQNQLRQLFNKAEIIGTLKSKDLERKVSQKGNSYIGGSLTVNVIDGDKINEIRVKVMVMETSKLFKGIETVMNDYKTVDDHGKDAADRVRINGEITLQEYYNQQGNLVQFNEIKGIFYNRLTPEQDQRDKAIATIETIIDNFIPKIDGEGTVTGEYNVNGFTVGYNGVIIELKNTIIGSNLAEQFINLYQPGNTGKLTYKINNYVEVQEVVEEAVPSHGFGSTESVSDNIAKNFVNNLEIVGGDLPYMGTIEYTVEEIEQAKKNRAIAIQTLQAPPPATPPTGFGTNAASPVEDNDELPDF